MIPLLSLLACSSDDGPTAKELIKAHPWRVSNYDVQASASGVTIPQNILDPFITDALANAPLNGTITFNTGTFTIDDQGTILEGTWTLSDDETTFTMTFNNTSQTFTFQVLQLTEDSYNLKYTVEQDVTFQGISVPVTFEITAFLVPVN